MESRPRANLQTLKVVSFESRRAGEMAELIRRYGGEPIMAPSLREIPLEENRAALDLLPQLEHGSIDVLILTTGVGTKTLYSALLTAYPAERITAAFRRTKIVARGPKPAAASKEIALTPSITVPEPNTWREIIASLESAGEIGGRRIAIQEYGIRNTDLIAALESAGASIVPVPIYRWALPADTAPLRRAIEKLLVGEIDVALFTNGAQADHLFKVAAEIGQTEAVRAVLRQIVVASVGPVCTEVLGDFGIEPDIEPPHAKMGSLVAATAKSAPGILGARWAG